ncbi:MAG: D-sedoheptulose 7-phosphate isomerase [Thermoplasmata archaeon]|nr:D-sedoheptulose 7-phosphate isomerase [Thermoplasmata archaeon]
MIEEIESMIRESIGAKQKMLEMHGGTIAKIVEVMCSAIENGGKVLWCGNGGSAADAQHLSCELVSKFYVDRGALASIALTTNTSILTAVANDYDFDRVFVRQVEALGKKGDVLVGISTSGNSKNVIAAMKKAREMGIATVGFTGETGGAMKDWSDILLNVPSKDTPRIQEAHITAGHIICYLIEKRFAGK